MNTKKEITLTIEINEIKDYGTKTRAEMIQALSRAYRDNSLAGEIIKGWILALPPSATFRTYLKNGKIIIERTYEE